MEKKGLTPFKGIEELGHEEVVFCYDEETGLKAIIAIHDTTLGPAIGGTRFYDYANEEDALYDVLRLSRGMTYKNAAVGLHAGGGKAVIIGDAKKLKNKAFLRKYGEFVNSLGGKYYTAEDMNINEEDVEIIGETNPYVVGRKDISGNPSPFTALGVYMGIKATAKELFGSDDLKGKVIAIQGIGAVGYPLAEMLRKDGAELIVADINQAQLDKAVKELDAKVVGVDEIPFVECDIFAPSALGAVISVDNARKLKCKAVAGAANNVLVNDEAGDLLDELGILYAPDYIINGGGVLNCGYEIEPGGYDQEKLTEMVKGVGDNVSMVFKLAKEAKVPTYKAADMYAEEIILKAKQAK